MTTPQDHRTDFVNGVIHIRSTTSRVVSNSGPTKSLTAPDLHRISEGLFLSAVTRWEEFCQVVFVTDLACSTAGVLRHDARTFRTANAPLRLAELMLTHIDHPNAFYDWSEFGRICTRADRFLGSNHRFAPPPPIPPAIKSAQSTVLPTHIVDELVIFKRIRNAVAHKSDKAWNSFLRLIKGPPFNLPANKRKGITPGRFLCTTQWGGNIVLHHSLDTLETAA